MTAPIDDHAIAATLLRLCRARGPDKTICPSEAARALAPEDAAWRALMPRVRTVGARLAAEGRIVATRRGALIDLLEGDAARGGPIRFGAPRTSSD